METKQSILRAPVEVHATVGYVKLLSLAQQCFYGKFILPVKIKFYASMQSA
jgi:hypothetical protein